MAAVPNCDERNRVVWDAWDNAGGSIERNRARSRFPAEKYETHPDVCYFLEHQSTVTGPDGKPMVMHNNVERFRAIVQENNLRIRDTGAYAGLVDKHTLDPREDDKGKERPKTVGFVGPFRLGMAGDVQPRFAIFGDEHHRRDKADVLADRPRRSVEVLTMPANGRPYLDPIACLSEAPRLPLPVRYSAVTESGDDVTVEIYESVPAAMAGGSNTFLPGGKRRDGYGAEAGDAITLETNAVGDQLTDQQLRQIADAIMQTPQMQWVAGQMQAGEQTDPTADPATPPAGQPPVAAVPVATPPATKETNVLPAIAGAAARTVGGMAAGAIGNAMTGNAPATHYQAPRPETPGDDVNTEKYAAIEARLDAAEKLIEKYAASDEATNKRLKQLTHQNAVLQMSAADADRKQRIDQLATKYPHAVVADEEYERCLYSAEADMNNDAFDRHIEMIESYAARSAPLTRMVPTGHMPAPALPTPERINQDAKIGQRSTEIYSAAQSRGERMTADEAWTAAEKEIAG